ncbi:hypothetical protein OB955_11610 [Halobacteria archaeon AArc-m2/3/4]|uniref:Uncharacterized protein n=1 Tax=Natronoglomus mannanivorans TaxID=2979990 RepID=A0ABT2QEM9_9EURY|nr:hypothetical protein [Halobacteria archaeon AArc-m2/3/4]
MGNIPYESLIGIAYGLLTEFVPALVVGVGAIGVGLVGDRSVSVPVSILVPIGTLATIAGAIGTGVAIGIFDPNAGRSELTRLTMASTVAGLIGVVATSHGTQIARELPHDRTFPTVRGQALSADAVDAVDAMGQVTIRPTGAIREFEGYPPLSPELRTSLEDGSWRFPADLQLVELERRLAQRLRTAYDLSQVDVSVDGRGRATVTAAPPAKGVATTLSEGTRAVTVSGLLPTGIERGDSVAISARGRGVRGEVLAVGTESDSPGHDNENENRFERATDRRHAHTGFDGGVGQLTVAVETADAGALLEASTHRLVVLPSGDNHEFEAATLLEDAGEPVTAVEVADGESIDPAETLGVCSDEQWQFAPNEEITTSVDRAFVVGSREGANDD